MIFRKIYTLVKFSNGKYGVKFINIQNFMNSEDETQFLRLNKGKSYLADRHPLCVNDESFERLCMGSKDEAKSTIEYLNPPAKFTWEEVK